MAYKKVGGDGSGEPLPGMLLSGTEIGTTVEGIYKGYKMVVGCKGKGKQKCHRFIQPDGNSLDVLGFGLMDHILKEVKDGSMTKVTYTGKKSDYHQCTVEVDDEFQDDEPFS